MFLTLIVLKSFFVSLAISNIRPFYGGEMFAGFIFNFTTPFYADDFYLAYCAGFEELPNREICCIPAAAFIPFSGIDIRVISVRGCIVSNCFEGGGDADSRDSSPIS